MPPLEALKVLLSIWTSKKTSVRGKPLNIRVIDVSRTHFYGKARREVYIELPDEGATPGMAGLLNKSMYGSQDASAIWEGDYIETLQEAGTKRGRSSGAIFYDGKLDVRKLAHGDDFVILSDDDGIEHYTDALSSKYVVKIVATVGPEHTDDKQVVMLSRVVRWVEDGFCTRAEYEPDPSHSEIILKSMGLENGD